MILKTLNFNIKKLQDIKNMLGNNEQEEIRRMINNYKENSLVFEFMEQNLKFVEDDLRDIMHHRRQRSENNLMCLPKPGKKSTVPWAELAKLPSYDPKDNEKNLFNTWQYVSKLAELFDLNDEATIASLAARTSKEVAQFLKINKKEPLGAVIQELQSRFEPFPTPEEWDKTFEKFQRKQAEPLMDALNRFQQVIRRKYHSANQADFEHILKKTAVEKFDTFVSKDTFRYIEKMVTDHELDKYCNDKLSIRLGLAKLHEDTFAQWKTKYQTAEALNHQLMKDTCVPIIKAKLKTINKEMVDQYLPDNGQFTKRARDISPDRHNLPSRMITETNRDQQQITLRFLNHATIIGYNDIERKARTKKNKKSGHEENLKGE